MNPYILIFTLFSFFGGTAFAARPYLYEIRKDGRTSYVMGTQHSDIDLWQYPHYVVEAVKKMKFFAAEWPSSLHTNESEEGDEKTKPHATPLSAISRARLRERGIPKKFWKDCVVVKELYENWEAYRHSSYHGVLSLDTQLEDVALEAGKTIIQLDNDEDMAVVEKLDSDKPCNANDLIESYTPREVREGNRKSTRDFYSGNPTILEKVEGEDDFLTVRRNQNWLPQIVARARHEGGVFVAVGADHLLGHYGLLSLLRREGFQVIRAAHVTSCNNQLR